MSIHNRNRSPWTPGQYVVGLRGGPNGVKTKEGEEIHASSTFYLVAQGHKLVTDEDLTLLRAQTGSEAAARAAAAQLNALIDAYTLGGVFAAVNQVFPHEELAALTAFTVAPVNSNVVEVDPGRAVVPLPIDLLRDETGHISSQGACGLAQGTYSAVTGACTDSHGNPNAASAGFKTLDGFSTTGAILIPVSDLILANTVTSSTVQLWDLSGASPQLVDPNTYIIEPKEVTQSGLAQAIVLQPAGATSGDATSVFRTRPLKDATDYAVVVSDQVQDKTGKPLGQGTVMKILQFTNPVSVGGKSQLIGIDDTTAGAMERMRQRLPAIIAASGFTSAHVAMAYTFHTQSILSTAVQLAALPYGTPSSGASSTIAPVPGSTKLYCTAAVAASNPNCSASTVDDAYSAYGVDKAVVPNGHVGYVIETVVPTFNKLRCNTGDTNCTDTGAFSAATVQPVVEPINVLIALPPPPYNGSCAPPSACSIPLLVFRHGIGGGRADMLRIADRFNQNGIAVAAIDAAKHGDRSYCKASSECAAGASCVAIAALAGEGDAPQATPGQCMNGTTAADFARRTSCATCSNTKAIPLASSNFLISANFFRTRDSLRQDLIDQSQLVRVLSPDPTGAQPGNLITTAVTGVQCDNTKIWYAGQSLGAIQGTPDVAANPRISKAVLNVGGGTVVDVFATSPAFTPLTNQLLTGLNIQPGTAAYLQFLVVAKTILDPADPVNFAGHLQSNTLPNLLVNQNGTVPQAAKALLTQAAYCDQVVPNPWNYILDSTAGTGPLPGFPGFGGAGTFQLFYKSNGSAPDLTTCPAPGGTNIPTTAVPHAFFNDFVDTAMTSQAQSDAAAFLQSGTNPSTLVVLP